MKEVYSYLNNSMGLLNAAFRAGAKPNIMPIHTETKKATMIDKNDIMVEIPVTCIMSNEILIPTNTPIIPPIMLINIDSEIN